VPAYLVPVYWTAQLVGAFVAAVLVYADYAQAFARLERLNDFARGTMTDGKLVGPAAGGAGVFATFPAFDNVAGNFLSEFLGTAVLLFAVRTVTDRRNAPPGANLEPVLVGAIVWSIGLSLGGLTGYAINPARDLGPRAAAAVLGWGTSVFASHGWYFWIPVVAPLAGGVFGALLYDLAVRPNLPLYTRPSPPGELSP
jgi:glycerol uptake facilitator-like aquaporin